MVILRQHTVFRFAITRYFMYLNNEKINAKLLFIISLSLTAIAIYLFQFASFGQAAIVPHNFIQNVLFINITFFGSGFFCFCLILFLFYKKKNAIAWLLTGSAVITVLIIQLSKIYLNNEGIKIFTEDEQYLFNSFTQREIKPSPSSHTAIAFAIATVLALFFKNKTRSFLFLLTACIVAYSRIYLDHHTLADLFAGAFTGIASGAIGYYYYLNHRKVKRSRFIIAKKIIYPEFQ